MKIKEIRELSKEELNKHCKEFKHELVNLRIQKQTGQLENFARIGNVKKFIARIKTVLKEKTNK